MAKYMIRGGSRIEGEFTPHGAKNAALPILAASIMTEDENLFYNCPDISDVSAMKEILVNVGCKVEECGAALLVDSSRISCCSIPVDLMEKMRSSVFLAGPLLARCGKVVISQPGGCSIGRRPIDIHIRALEKMGTCVKYTSEGVELTAIRLHGANLNLEYPSVGATENIMMAATGAEGITIIRNAAREPEIVGLQDYLVKCGARISGAGTSKIVIIGGGKLHGAAHEIMADRIEAGTFMMAAACTGGELYVDGIDPSWLKICSRFLKFAGCTVKKYRNGIFIKGPGRLYPVGRIQTGPYPAFPTDLQPQLTAIMCGAAGESRVEETVFESRYGFTKELIKMGADIEICRRIAIIKGNEFLRGTHVAAPDLRGGAALVLAGLQATGETAVDHIEYIERGYCDFHSELRRLGAEIDRCI